MTAHFAALFLGTLLDRGLGDPAWAWSRVPHPVVLIGRVIAWAERRWNDHDRRREVRRSRGLFLVLGLTGGMVLLGLCLEILFVALLGSFAFVLRALVLGIFLAGNSLDAHVKAVAGALASEGLEGGQRTVSMIVGRDPDGLDEAGVARAAIETLAENASDGYVAPLLFFLVLGLPGLLVYKAANTADSMIGHMNRRYRSFGWAAARFDDFLNVVPARLTALLLGLAARLAGFSARAAWRTAWRDARLHRSPNAGWPECAMAGALGLALGGPRRYGDLVVEAPLLNASGRYEAGLADIEAALKVFRRLCDSLAVATFLLLLLSAL